MENVKDKSAVLIKHKFHYLYTKKLITVLTATKFQLYR